MRLWTGEPGSGKTTRVLAEVRARLAEDRSDVRLLVPTATMARHLRNELARGGLVFRPSQVTTLYEFVDQIEGLPRQARAVEVALALDQWLEECCPPELRPIAGTPGLRAALEGALYEIVNAGLDSLTLEALERIAFTAVPMVRVLRQALTALEAELKRRGAVLRPERLLKAADKLPGGEFYVDGFFAFTAAEQALLAALAARGAVTVTLPLWPGAESSREALRRAGARETVWPPSRRGCKTELVEAASREAEALETARRILELHGQGKAWNEMGIVLRDEQPYAPLLATTFARLGIPARFYFPRSLDSEAVSAFFKNWVTCALAGFDGMATLTSLRHPAAPFSRLERWREIELAVREQLPFNGLDAFLKTAAEPALDGLREWAHAAEERLSPAEWAARLQGFAAWIERPDPDLDLSPDDIQLWAARASALRAWREVWRESVEAMAEEPVTLERFWKVVATALHQARLYTPQEGPRQCVHVMGVYEARQWELPVIFVCGLVEGEFPRYEGADPFLEETLRRGFREQGIPLATSSERRQEENFLLELAFTRASERVVNSWPKYQPSGEETQRAYALDRFHEPVQTPPHIRIAAAREPHVVRAAALASGEALSSLASRYEEQRPTWIEDFLQCPFLFFSRHTLGLDSHEGGLEEKLGPLALGSFAHGVLDEWHKAYAESGEAPPMGALFDRRWQLFLRLNRIPDGWRAEAARSRLRHGLTRFAAEPLFQEGWTTESELKVSFQVSGVKLKGRIDRVDRSGDGRVVLFDFKLSGESGVREKIKKNYQGSLVQGGLYAFALKEAGSKVEAVNFVPLRGFAEPMGWRVPGEIEALIDTSKMQAAEAQRRILAGSVEVAPRDDKICGYCDFRDACRIGSAAAAAQVEVAS